MRGSHAPFDCALLNTFASFTTASPKKNSRLELRICCDASIHEGLRLGYRGYGCVQ